MYRVTDRGVCVCRGEGEIELATSLFAGRCRGVDDMNLSSERCEGYGLLLGPIEALSVGIPKRGGVGLVRHLLGGVKDSLEVGD